MNKAPCKDCFHRTVTCHSVCRKYQEWQKEEQKRKAWESQFKYERSDGLMKGERKKLIGQARGYIKKRRKIGE